MSICVKMSIQTSMKNGALSDSFQCKPEMVFFKVIFLIQMTYLEILYERGKLFKFQKRLYYLQTNTIVTRRTVTTILLCNCSRKNDSLN